MGRKRYEYRKRIVAKFDFDEFEYLLNKKGDKTWNEFILELAGYKRKKESSGVSKENGGCSK